MREEREPGILEVALNVKTECSAVHVMLIKASTEKSTRRDARPIAACMRRQQSSVKPKSQYVEVALVEERGLQDFPLAGRRDRARLLAILECVTAPCEPKSTSGRKP